MTNPQKGKQDAILGVTQNEAKLVLLGILYANSEGKVDFEKFVQTGNYKNVSSAASAYRQAKRKFMDANTTSGDATNTSTAAAHGSADPADIPTSNGKSDEVTPKEPPTKRRKVVTAAAAVEDTSGGNADGKASSVALKKRIRKTPSKKKAAAKKKGDDVDDDGDENMAATISKKAPQKPETSTAPEAENEDTPMDMGTESKADAEVMEEAGPEVESGATERPKGTGKGKGKETQEKKEVKENDEEMESNDS
ncbi:hypothetical protein BJY01DRAFT_251897 [Aspergillus pseudoustus]|uniref:Uncharacterized protein n=1 Tax=Aspergillus pseudoustus TaxID=1810923 RepID=A0ABR4J929_9EURO